MSAITYNPEQKDQIARAVNKWYEAFNTLVYGCEELEFKADYDFPDYDFKDELSETFPDLSFTFDPSSKSWLIL